jgi:hypothetical protein
MRRELTRSLAIFLASAAVTSVFFINACHIVYRCGCDFLWAAADAHCNIHNPAGRHCPFCSFGYSGYGLIFGIIVAVQAGFSFLSPWNWNARLAASFAAFPTTFVLVALVLGAYTGYWN